ncbi:RHS repeat-associated core domain-containing protein [Aestuariibacter sp. AA17]|uniref:RHS repeat-associated core domain-containing protein n=1 Tax=Fluctibacter corallii TaxID=2984329 RepID=A0ABT3AD44_9ALTE|nr:RHS repeat-associated core domain-containing protein [Aestuariibacter sp. AA17]MCV2886487.1 RHS repeat-associated core domain-containing protein [Aestuariibacter sp. AA17]
MLYQDTPAGGVNNIYLGSKLIAKDGFIPNPGGTQNHRPYGSSIEGEADDIGYTGRKFDTDLGLSYMQARYYDPVIGRFYSNDPVGFINVHTFNRYAYANNNPYKYVDPDGRSAKLARSAFNVVRDASRNGWDFKRAGKDEIQKFVDNATTLADGQFTADDVFAVVDLFTGFGGESKDLANSIQKFFKKSVPSNARDSVIGRSLPNGGVAVQAKSDGIVPGSSAVYEKQIGANGQTIQNTKTTYLPNGNIDTVKKKMPGGGVFRVSGRIESKKLDEKLN